MRNIEEIETELKKEVTSALVPLQTRKDLSIKAFTKMVQLASEGAVVLKGKKELPRTFLKEIFVSIQVIRRESEYNPNPQIISAANQLDMIFGLILSGESLEDRKPGIPRIL